MSGVTSSGETISSCDNGDWICVNDVNLGTGYDVLKANIAAASDDGVIEVRLDSATGTKVGTLYVRKTDGFTNYKEQTVRLTGASGTHNVYFVFKDISEVANCDWFNFIK